MARRLALGSLIAIVVWFFALLIIDVVVGSRQGATTAARIGETLQATATVGDLDVALLRGNFSIQRLAVHRDDVVGHLALEVAEVECSLAPLGWALIDHGCRELALRGVRLEVSTAALFKLQHRKRAPIRADHFTIDDAELAFSPSAILPSLGRIAIRIDHAEAGPTLFITPLSWIFALETMRARVDLPANLSLELAYDHGVFGATGSLFGAAPVKLPLQLPVAALYTDAHAQIQALVKLGTDLAEQLVAKRAEDWLRSKL
ncbi:hypothetical protein BH11MYX1_BH11MYX1_26170 [soil metagenome]